MNLLGEQQHFIYPTVEAYAHAVEAARPSLNVGTLIGHTALRNNHMDDLFRPANETEIAGMRVQLRDALRQGALGLSTGLAYASAFQSTTEEVMALAEELAAGKGVYTTHLRSEFEPILEALDEAFRIGRHGNVPVVVFAPQVRRGEKLGAYQRDAGLFSMRCASSRISPATVIPTPPARRRWI